MSGRTVRMSLTLSSAASVGAFEAGAVAAVLVAAQRLNERFHMEPDSSRLHLDAVGATSAGSLVGLLAARCLLAGVDPVHVMYEAWVRQASLARLRSRSRGAPLSLRRLEQHAARLLDPRDAQGRPTRRTSDAARQRGSVLLRLALGNLQGLAFPIRGRVSDDPPLAGLSHADWIEFDLATHDDVSAYLQPRHHCPLAAVLASMSHPAAFPPRLLDRRPDRDRYTAAGVANFPPSGHFWYVDGAALLTAPIGETLAAARRVRQRDGALHGDGATPETPAIHLVVNPHTGGPDPAERWGDPEQKPGWLPSLSRLVASLSPQPLYRDLRKVEKINGRLAQLDAVADTIGPHLGADARQPLEKILAEAGDRPQPADATLVDLLRRVLRQASGLAGKERVVTEVVSPMRLIDRTDSAARRSNVAGGQQEVPDLLAGEFLGRFGGLLDRRLRHSDFVTGWHSGRRWLAAALPRYGIDPAATAEALVAVDARRVRYGRSGHRGAASLKDTPLPARLRLLRTVMQVAGSAVHGSLGHSHR